MTTSFSKKVGIGGLDIYVNNFRGSALESHAPPLIRDDLIEGRTICLHPTTPSNGLEDIEFHSPPDPECSYILNQTRLSGYFIVKTATGEFPEAKELVKLSQHYAACLFSQMEVYLNDTQVNDLNCHLSFPYRHYFDNVLSKSRKTLNKLGKAEGYYLPHLDHCFWQKDATKTNGYDACDDKKERQDMIVGGKKVYFNLALVADVFFIDKYLPPNIDIKIKLRRDKTIFPLGQSDTTKNYDVYLDDVKLFMRKVLPTLSVRERYKAQLLRSPCVIRYKDSQLKIHTIPMNVTNFIINNINNDVLPTQIIFAVQAASCFSKSGETNGIPFKLDDINIIAINLRKNGQNVLPKPIQCDFTQKYGGLIELYNHFGVNMNKLHAPTLEKFVHGDLFFAFDLTPDNCNSYHNHLPATGNLELEVSMSKPTNGLNNLISYAIYDSGIIIDKNQQVTKITY